MSLLPNLAALAHAPSALGEDTAPMTEGWEELFDQLHDGKIPSELIDKIREEAAPPPDPVPRLTFRDAYNRPSGNHRRYRPEDMVWREATVVLQLDAAGTTNASVTMVAPPNDPSPAKPSLQFTVYLTATTDAAKKMQRYWDSHNDLGKRVSEVMLTTTAETPALPPNTMRLRFKYPAIYTNTDKILHMLATACPMIFGTALAMMREHYDQTLHREDYPETVKPPYVESAARLLFQLWARWVSTLKTMPVGIGMPPRDDSWKATRADEIGAEPVRERVERAVREYRNGDA